MGEPRRRPRRRLERLLLITCAVIAGGVLLSQCRVGSPGLPLPPDVGVVVAHVDGDTIDVRIGRTTERVRFIGIDTPETYRRDRPADCFGHAAAARAAELLPLGTEVRLTGDVVGRDDYGRLLAYVYRRHDELFVNAVLVAEGFARPLRIAPNESHAAEFAALATAARRAGVGLWAECIY